MKSPKDPVLMPTAPPNISKSVARAFAVLELFRARQIPMTAATLRQLLNIPQPSARALLKNLVELEYLQFNTKEKTYFPTMHLAKLGDWIGASVIAGIDVSRTIDAIAIESGETASLCIINDLNIETIYTKTAAHPLGLRLRPGVGETLWLTVAGRTLLSQFEDTERDALLQAMIKQERNPVNRQKIPALLPLLKKLRTAGYYAAYDIYLQGVGAVCVGVMIGGQPAVIAVAGVKDRIREHEQDILLIIQKHLSQLP